MQTADTADYSSLRFAKDKISGGRQRSKPQQQINREGHRNTKSVQIREIQRNQEPRGNVRGDRTEGSPNLHDDLNENDRSTRTQIHKEGHGRDTGETHPPSKYNREYAENAERTPGT